ncbi:hypothetical protein O1611_g8526 [Lasiodiplodia mahajangana]|uniref:Uncharacterized protein n=1 Tax=Lasiodiplodia mahajangana TaxID=1108764 RepID=A0ACC2JCH0_9PEZI|nr:hypothetical protein O1611_g8526 [Lasiodiplodia mahajangana]
MGKAKTSKRGNAKSGPYDRPSKSNAAVNNVFKFTVGKVVDKAHLKPTDVVLEVGPGTGNLTVQIVNQARKVIAVEMDPRMAAEVTKRLQGRPEQKKLEVILGDVIKQDPLPEHDASRTSEDLYPHVPTARPGDSLYCRLSVNAQFWAKISHVLVSNPPSSTLIASLLRLVHVQADIHMRTNIRPPPQVDSSVVRIEPKTGSERPNISFEEFDGLLRVCFNRRNKVLRSLFLGNKEVLKLIESNYRLYCATYSIPLDDGLVDDVGEEEDMEVDENDNDASMDVDGDEEMPSFFSAAKTPDEGNASNKKGSLRKTRVAILVKEKVRKVLEETELAESRSAKLAENDFLRLLAAFNAEGIHFS